MDIFSSVLDSSFVTHSFYLFVTSVAPEPIYQNFSLKALLCVSLQLRFPWTVYIFYFKGRLEKETLNYSASYHWALQTSKAEQTCQRPYPLISGHGGEEQVDKFHTRVALSFLVCKDIFSYKNLQIYQYKIIMMTSVVPQFSPLGFLPIHLVEITLVKVISELYFARENDHFLKIIPHIICSFSNNELTISFLLIFSLLLFRPPHSPGFSPTQ